MAKNRNLARAITNAYFHFRELLQKLPGWKELLWSYLLPFLGLGIAIRIGTYFTWRLYRKLRPPSVSDLHKKALILLNQNKQLQEQQVERILWKCVETDSTYTPALLSLVALYAYHDYSEGGDGRNNNNNRINIKKALKLLDSDVCRSKNKDSISSAEFEVIRLDCQAIQAGQEIMVQQELRREQYLSLASLVSKKQR